MGRPNADLYQRHGRRMRLHSLLVPGEPLRGVQAMDAYFVRHDVQDVRCSCRCSVGACSVAVEPRARYESAPAPPLEQRGVSEAEPRTSGSTVRHSIHLLAGFTAAAPRHRPDAGAAADPTRPCGGTLRELGECQRPGPAGPPCGTFRGAAGDQHAGALMRPPDCSVAHGRSLRVTRCCRPCCHCAYIKSQ